MPSIEYWEGKKLESNDLLKAEVKQVFEFDRVDSDGSTETKGDLIGILGEQKVHISVKNASGKNTQVHLPTLESFARQLDMPLDVKELMDKFLGTNNQTQWKAWSDSLSLSAEEHKYQRIKSQNLPNWNKVEEWFNANIRKITVLLLQSLNEESPAPWLIWVNKKKGGLQIVDVNKLVDWIVNNCQWKTMPKGTVIRCALPSDIPGKIGKPMFFLQMKNSGGPPGGYNHCPQFHLHCNWPREFVIYENPKIRFQ